jgi:pimeloyl-ACP methyl ester carboxylesterase
MRAREPDVTDAVTAGDGVRIAYEVFDGGEPTLVLLPNSIVHSRQWKGQVPFLSRSYRVITYDGRGNGRSDKPVISDAFRDDRYVGDLEAVMDATGTQRAVIIGLCTDGVWPAVRFAAANPERVVGIVAFSVGVPLLTAPKPHYVAAGATFDQELPTYDGWAKMNRHHWRADYADWAQFFFGQIVSEPHSTKTIEDAIEWALDASVESMVAKAVVDFPLDRETVEATCRSMTCPLLIVHGTHDTCQSPERAQRLAELTGAPLVLVEGADHLIPGRHPVLANLLIRDFIKSLPVGVTS